MKRVRAIDLALQLGIPRRTMSSWCRDDKELGAELVGRTWWIDLDRLAGRPGISLVDAYTLPDARWIKAPVLARLAGISRKTMANWCKDRKGFAKRIGVDWYIDLEQFGASPDDLDALLVRLGIASQDVTEEGTRDHGN